MTWQRCATMIPYSGTFSSGLKEQCIGFSSRNSNNLTVRCTWLLDLNNIIQTLFFWLILANLISSTLWWWNTVWKTGFEFPLTLLCRQICIYVYILVFYWTYNNWFTESGISEPESVFQDCSGTAPERISNRHWNAPTRGPLMLLVAEPSLLSHRQNSDTFSI